MARLFWLDDRRVISGVIHVLKNGCRWSDCPTGAGLDAASGRIWQRPWLHQARSLHQLPSTALISRRTARPTAEKGVRRQDAGPSCGGQTTKIHALTDTTGRPFAFELNAGNVADITAAASLLNMVLGARYLLADKGRDANTIRANLRRNGLVPVIPGRINRKRKTVYDKRRYRDRHRHTHRILDLKQSQP